MKHTLRKKFLHIRNNLDTTYQIQATEKIFKTLEESDIRKKYLFILVLEVKFKQNILLKNI